MIRSPEFTLSRLLYAVLISTALAVSPSYAASEVFVDFTPTGAGSFWGGNLATLTTGIGMDPISMTEVTTLETTILSELERVYVAPGFDISFMSFTGALPVGATNIIDFTKDESSSVNGATAPLPKGIATHDWLNLQSFSPDFTEVFPQSFDDIIDEFAGSTADARPGMIAELGIALAGTAAHELGHSYGLSHWDSYGLPSVGPAGSGMFHGEYILFDSMGFQNGSVMATGKTGLDEPGREIMRDLSRYSKAKLEIATDPGITPETLGAVPFFQTAEFPVPHPTFAMAQPLFSSELPISGLHAVNVHAAALGDIAGGGTGVDMYEFTTMGTGLVTVEVRSRAIYATSVETTLKIYDAGMTEIFASDDFSFGDGFPSLIFSTTAPIDSSFFDGDEDDPLVLNMELPDGTYFVEVTIDPDGIHAGDPMTTELFYDLLVTSETTFAPVPEPTSLALFSLGLMCCGARRRFF